jgi:hypothetical protein
MKIKSQFSDTLKNVMKNKLSPKQIKIKFIGSIFVYFLLIIILISSISFEIFQKRQSKTSSSSSKTATATPASVTSTTTATPKQSTISTQSQTATPASTPTSTPTSTTTPVSAEYYDTSKYCSGNTEENAFINAKSSTEFSTTRNEIDECRTLCSNTADCEMYLQSDSNTCLLYKDVKDVTMYCNSGSGHGYSGNVKIKNSLNPDNVVDESSIVPPPSITQPSSNNATKTLTDALSSNQTIDLTGVTVNNVICISATFGGDYSGSQNGESLGIISYSQNSTTSTWLFYIWSSPYTKMIMVPFNTSNNTNEIKVGTITAGYVEYDATVSETALKNAWDSKVSVSYGNYTVNNLTISTSSSESFKESYEPYYEPYEYSS